MPYNFIKILEELKIRRLIGFVAGLAFSLYGMGQTSKPYLVTDFAEKDFEHVLDLCHQGGFDYLLHRYPFSTYGHYLWNPDFVSKGNRSVASMVQEAANQGVELGVFVYADAISTNDAYFAPRYHKQLVRQGEVHLFDDINAEQIDMAIYKSEVLNVPSTLNLLLIDDELISYGTMEPAGELMLLHHCKRGVFGTKASAHHRKTPTYKVSDSPERYVYPDGALRDSVRHQLSKRINDVGIRFVEYSIAPGHEMISEAQRVQNVERWSALKAMGEDKPLMLGWFRVHVADRHQHSTTIEDVEWLLAKSVAFDAGYGLVLGKVVMSKYGQVETILAQTRFWNELRSSGLVDETLSEALKDPYQDWHLDRDSLGRFMLYKQQVSRRFRCAFSPSDTELLTTEPWEWKNDEESEYALRLQVEGKASITDPDICVAGTHLLFPCTLKPNQFLVYDFDSRAYITDQDFNVIEEVNPVGQAVLPAGRTEVSFSCKVPNKKNRPEVNLRYMTREKPMIIDANP